MPCIALPVKKPVLPVSVRKRTPFIFPDVGRRDVDVLLEFVMHWHLVLLAAFLAEADVIPLSPGK